MPPLQLFGGAACRTCKVARSLLERSGVEFEYHDVEQEPEAAERLRELGYMQVPVFVDGDSHFGFEPDRLKSAIASRKVGVSD